MSLWTLQHVLNVVVCFCDPSQEDSARILLFRGADRCVKNYANQTAAEVAIITDNVHISDLINKFKASDVGKPVFVLVSEFHDGSVSVWLGCGMSRVSDSRSYQSCV